MSDRVTRSRAATPLARHGRLPRRHAWAGVIRFIGAALAVILVATVSIGAIEVAQLSGNVKTIALPAAENAPTIPPGVGEFEGGFNMLIVGSDECVDTGGCPGREEKLADFTMLLHIADDHQSAVAVSFPRDLIVPVPACPRENGSGNYPAMSALQINATLTYGGIPCTALTVGKLSGLPIQYAGLMTFEGVRQISTALGGVEVCIDAPIRDRYSGLNLTTAGSHLLEGEQALQFLRTRHGIGDGSDTGRIGSQQAFLSSMVRKIKSQDTLTNPAKLFALATAASQNMTVSDNLASVTTLASMALVIKDIPLEKITFVKYPAGSRSIAPGRVFPITDAANELFEKIAADQPFATDQSQPAVGTVTAPGATPDPAASVPAPSGSTPVTDPSAGGIDPSASATPEVIKGATGQTAADQTCSKANR